MKFVLIVVLLFCSGVSKATVDNNDLDNIIRLAEDGKFQQALDKHLWFHEASKSSTGMGGVRLSYAISSWVELGEKYPPAKEALSQVRDKNKSELLSGNGDFGNFHDFSAINHALGEDDATLELFLILDDTYPEQSSSYYIVAENLLIEHKKYNICAKYIGDPIIKYENLRYMREVNLSFSKNESSLTSAQISERADESYVNDVLKLIELLIAIDKRDEAVKVQERALAYFPNERIETAI